MPRSPPCSSSPRTSSIRIHRSARSSPRSSPAGSMPPIRKGARSPRLWRRWRGYSLGLATESVHELVDEGQTVAAVLCVTVAGPVGGAAGEEGAEGPGRPGAGVGGAACAGLQQDRDEVTGAGLGEWDSQLSGGAEELEGHRRDALG